MTAPLATHTEVERDLLLTFEDDTNRSPWMVTTDLHSLCGNILRALLRRHRADWYVSGDLAVLYTRPNGSTGQVAPDVLVAFADNHLRDIFDSRVEPGGFPPFVLEVVSTESRTRDTGRNRKPELYRLLGAREYVIFDPTTKRTPVLQGYRCAINGAWEAWPLERDGALRSDILGLHLRVEGRLLRLFTHDGQRLLTDDEALLEAEAELARLRAELARREHGKA